MALCHQAKPITWDYLRQYWPRYMLSYDITRQQWTKRKFLNSAHSTILSGQYSLLWYSHEIIMIIIQTAKQHFEFIIMVFICTEIKFSKLQWHQMNIKTSQSQCTCLSTVCSALQADIKGTNYAVIWHQQGGPNLFLPSPFHVNTLKPRQINAPHHRPFVRGTHQ